MAKVRAAMAFSEREEGNDRPAVGLSNDIDNDLGSELDMLVSDGMNGGGRGRYTREEFADSEYVWDKAGVTETAAGKI